MMPLNGREWRGTKEPLDEGERGEWKRVNIGLKLNIRTTKIMASGPITSWQIESGNSNRFYFPVLQNHFRQWLQPWNSKMLAPWHKSYDKPRLCIKKQRCYFADKGPSSQSYGFSSSHVWMWEFSPYRRLSAEELMLFNCGVREDSWESLEQQGDQTSQS